MPSGAHVAILLCTYNGAAYLPEQLASFLAQTHTDWSLWVNDDGSSDATRDIIATFKAANPDHRVEQFDGPRQGFVQNFFSLASHDINADYFAFSDQDDIWEIDKLERGVVWLNTQLPAIPSLYCARTLYVSADNQPLYPSTLFKKPFTFRNALVQSVAGANTMLLNGAARQLLLDSLPKANVVSHDWWLYLLVTGVGGHLYYDATPCMRYRQHGNNIQGENVSLRARTARAKSLFAGVFRQWIARNLIAIEPLRDRLTPENRALLDQFMKARNQWCICRLISLRRTGIYRQTRLSNLGLWLAAVTNNL